MFEPSVVVYARERWRVVRTADSDQPLTYVVVDTAGMELRREHALEDASAWVDQRVVEGYARLRAPSRKPVR